MKTIILITITIIFGLILAGFQKSNNLQEKMDTTMDKKQKNLSEATFAGGCFWCVESDFEKIDGVVKALSGYAGGQTKNPTVMPVDRRKTPLTGKYLQAVPGMQKRFKSFMTP